MNVKYDLHGNKKLILCALKMIYYEQIFNIIKFIVYLTTVSPNKNIVMSKVCV